MQYVQAGTICIRVHRDRKDSQFAAGANNTQSDFSTVSDEKFFYFLVQTLSVLEGVKSGEREITLQFLCEVPGKHSGQAWSKIIQASKNFGGLNDLFSSTAGGSRAIWIP